MLLLLLVVALPAAEEAENVVTDERLAKKGYVKRILGQFRHLRP